MKQYSKQEIKDKLWRVDETIRADCDKLADAVVEAWKDAVEGGRWERQLRLAHTLARGMQEYLYAALEDLEVTA